jgi:Phage holin family Hol44, in holin superfamily V
MEQEMTTLIQSYIVEQALILIPALWVLGYFLKQSPKVADWVIVWILAFAGVVGSLAIVGFDAQGVIQGVLVAGAAVLGNQMIRQVQKK